MHSGRVKCTLVPVGNLGLPPPASPWAAGYQAASGLMARALPVQAATAQDRSQEEAHKAPCRAG